MKTLSAAARPVAGSGGVCAYPCRVSRPSPSIATLFFCSLLLAAPPAAQAQSYRILHHFTGGTDDGAGPLGSLTQHGSTLYGMTRIGGAADNGTVFRVNPDGSDFRVLHHFTGAAVDGQRPYGALLAGGSLLYGLATSENTSFGGTLFRLATDGSGFQLLRSFGGPPTDGRWPYSGVIRAGDVLYGMTVSGGSGDLSALGGSWGGTIFRINVDGTQYQVLHHFTGTATDGGWSAGELTLSGSVLYGLTFRGGPSNNGVIFRINTDGSDFAVLHAFAGGAADGARTHGSLLLSGSTLYGMTGGGGLSDLGTIFRINTDGTGFGLVHSFAGGSNDGAGPGSALIRFGSLLYGTTDRGGPADVGTVFQLNVDGTGYRLLHRFAGGSAGASPSPASVLLIGGTLYGMTASGGSSNQGVIYALDLPASFGGNGQQINQAVANGIALGDFNGDGNLDACVGNDEGTRVYLGDGAGRFTDSGQALTGPMPAAGDVDGNGTLDLLIGTTVWRNDGQGRFTAQTGAIQTSESGGISGKLADLDGDGDLDVFATINYSGGRVYLNNGLGQFADSGQRIGGEPVIGSGQIGQIALGDVDGNGTVDAITTGWRWNGSVACPNRVWLNDGAGVFRDSGQTLEEGGSHVHGLALGDLNRDGRPDLVLGIQDYNRSGRIYLNDGTGRFVGGVNLGGTRGEELALADFNGDGALDVFAGSSASGSSRVWLNEGSGTFRDSGLSFLPAYWNWAVATGDFNRDGRPDVFVGNSQLAPNTGQAAPAQIWLNETASQVIARSQALTPGTTLTVSADPARTTQWHRNGAPIAGASAPTLVVPNLRPPLAGIYSASEPNATNVTEATIVGLTSTTKVLGTGTELTPHDIQHPNGNYYDQIGVTGAALTLTADSGQAARASFIDLNDDIVQVEFSGAGSLTLVFDAASAPAEPVNYNQPGVLYVRGHAGIVIVGADETTNVTVFTVGRATAFDRTGTFNILQPISPTNNPANNGSPLFVGHGNTAYDGFADLGFIAIHSRNGRFGGVRVANTGFFADRGFTGIYAPGVQFTGPLFVHDINASGEATPVLIVGSTTDARITGGTLTQDNGRAVQVSGLTRLRFADGMSSHGTLFAAQHNRARLEENGIDVTAPIVVDPP